MPLYEFYCKDCHTIYNFFSPRINTEKRPDCPKCGRNELERQVSVFAISKNRPDSEDGGDGMDGMPDLSGLDESKLERAMAMMAHEAEGMNEDDPRQAAQLMRKLCDVTGMNFGEGMEEALTRMEAGEDPEQIEAEMGDMFENMDFSPTSAKKLRRTLRAPARDETIYDM
ncbi:FmdB family zinc ribbon protein [Desulfonatronum thioautotrophicum]|uniref:FmdB family zinc ribbon protein n=1 Tax=Desulfonatronum thioautotrophicum TaxID=617001 RepID=UPI0005EB4461|nr:zinc ribbon domain-containing protein [Desulfonatronum thioautotrophicum]